MSCMCGRWRVESLLFTPEEYTEARNWCARNLGREGDWWNSGWWFSPCGETKLIGRSHYNFWSHDQAHAALFKLFYSHYVSWVGR